MRIYHSNEQRRLVWCLGGHAKHSQAKKNGNYIGVKLFALKFPTRITCGDFCGNFCGSFEERGWSLAYIKYKILVTHNYTEIHSGNHYNISYVHIPSMTYSTIRERYCYHRQSFDINHEGCGYVLWMQYRFPEYNSLDSEIFYQPSYSITASTTLSLYPSSRTAPSAYSTLDSIAGYVGTDVEGTRKPKSVINIYKVDLCD